MTKHLVQFRLDEDTDKELTEFSIVLGIDKSKLLRMFVNRGIVQLKKDASIVGGIENLQISIKEVL